MQDNENSPSSGTNNNTNNNRNNNRNTKNILFVGNLPLPVNKEDVYELFSYFGRVRFINIVKDKPIAFVKMDSEDSAYYARLGINGTHFQGKVLRVESARSRNEERSSY